MNTYKGIGLMSGTSMDGLDLAHVTFTEENDSYTFYLDAFRQVDFDEQWKSRLMNLIGQSAEIYAKTNVYFGHWLGKAVKEFIHDFQLSPDFVASHGQTIFHQPQKNFTGQIGDGETMVTYLDCPLVTNFRNKDIALKGEGAPLISIVEKYLFPQFQLFLNLGGFSNMTAGELAFDISPCNIVLNHLYKDLYPESEFDYDPEGKVAASGQLLPDLLSQLNALSYYSIKPPKSLGWEWVVANVLPILSQAEAPIVDIMHTFVHHIGEQIGQAITKLSINQKTLLITGGGKHNEFLMSIIHQALLPAEISIDTQVSKEIIDYKEAIGFAFLGLRTLTGKTTTMSTVTGAEMAAVTGSIHLPPHPGKWSLLG